MACVYYLDVSELKEGMIHDQWDVLDENRKDKINSLNDTHEKLLSFGAGLLISWAFMHYGLSLTELKYTGDNKPFVHDKFHISIAHSGHYACLALSDHPVGVDVQLDIGYQKSIEDLYFSKKDKKRINSDVQKFYEVWCQKEAYIKLFGYHELKNIPSEIKGYSCHQFCLDDHYGCLLSEDTEFFLIKKNSMQIINELIKQGGENHG